MNVVVLIGIVVWVCSVQASLDGTGSIEFEREIGNESPIAGARVQRSTEGNSAPVWIGKKFLRACRAACQTFYGMCVPQVYDPESVFYPICEQHLTYRAAPKNCMDCMLENGLQDGEQGTKRFAPVSNLGPAVQLHSKWTGAKYTSRLRQTTQNYLRGAPPTVSQNGDFERLNVQGNLQMKANMPMRTTESQETSNENFRATRKPKKRITKPMRTTENPDASTDNFRINENPKKRVPKPMRTTEGTDASENFRVTEKPKKRITRPLRTTGDSDTSDNVRATAKPKKRITQPMRDSDNYENVSGYPMPGTAQRLKGNGKNSPKRNKINGKTGESPDEDYIEDRRIKV